MQNDNIVTLKEVLKKREINIDYVLDIQTLCLLAEEFELNKIDYLKVNFKLTPIANQKGIGVEATLKALVIHNCVVTLGPVPQSITENISIRYTPDGEDDILDQLSNSKVTNISLRQNYDVEPLIDGQINLYDIMHEYLSLSLFSNPRVANAKFDGFTLGHLNEQEKQQVNRNIERISEGQQPLSSNPFASLAALKQKIDD